MVNMILHYSDGSERSMLWGAMPSVWKEPVYDPIVDSNLVADRRTFTLRRQECRWGKTIAHYYENLSRDKTKAEADAERREGDQKKEKDS